MSYSTSIIFFITGLIGAILSQKNMTSQKDQTTITVYQYAVSYDCVNTNSSEEILFPIFFFDNSFFHFFHTSSSPATMTDMGVGPILHRLTEYRVRAWDTMAQNAEDLIKAFFHDRIRNVSILYHLLFMIFSPVVHVLAIEEIQLKY